MPPVARLADPISCGDTISGGSGNVFINGMPVARIGDETAGHPCGPPTTMASGNNTSVFANNKSVCRVGSLIIPHGTCGGPPHVGSVVIGSPDVFVG